MSNDTEDISLNFGEENETAGRKNIRWVLDNFSVGGLISLILASFRLKTPFVITYEISVSYC